MSNDLEKLPRLIERAASALAKATTAAEVLEAREQAGFAYDTAKRASRMTKVKDAHDAVRMACRKVMADALVIETQAQCRLADEYDAAQQRGEVAKQSPGRPKSVPIGNDLATATDVGLTRKQVHEARAVRDAEKAKPGVVRKTLEAKLAAGEDPTRADVKRAVKGKPKGGKRKTTTRTAPTPDIEERVAQAVVDEGKTLEQAKTEFGLTSVQHVKQAVKGLKKFREGQASPLVDRGDLSISAQQKFDAAIRAYKQKLDAAFHEAINKRVREFLEETILPKHRKEQEQAQRIMRARKGIMDKTSFRLIWSALHPDSRKSISDRKLAEAFDVFSRLEKLLLDEKQSPTDFQKLPPTMAEWDRIREAARQAKRKSGNAVRPR